jgi:hypothetical protein
VIEPDGPLMPCPGSVPLPQPGTDSSQQPSGDLTEWRRHVHDGHTRSAAGATPVERCFGKLTQFRAAAINYDKHEIMFQGTVDIRIWLRDPVLDLRDTL